MQVSPLTCCTTRQGVCILLRSTTVLLQAETIATVSSDNNSRCFTPLNPLTKGRAGEGSKLPRNRALHRKGFTIKNPPPTVGTFKIGNIEQISEIEGGAEPIALVIKRRIRPQVAG